MTHTLRTEIAADTGRRPTAGAFIAALSRIWTGIADRAGPYWRIYRQGAAGDPELQRDWNDILTRRRETMDEIARLVPPDGLHPDLSHAAVTDTLWAIANPDVFLLLTVNGGYDLQRFESWLRRTLTASLCT